MPQWSVLRRRRSGHDDPPRSPGVAEVRGDWLPVGWTVVDDLPVGPRDATLDRLVIGPVGVFAVRVVAHPRAAVWVDDDELRVDGDRYPWVRTVRGEARRTGRLLSAATGVTVPVAGVVAVAGARELTVRRQPVDVRVEALGRLASWLQAQPAVLEDDDVEQLLAVARRPETWALAAGGRRLGRG